MDGNPILICYNGSGNDRNAIESASALLGRRSAVVVDIGPPLTAAESLAAVSSVVPGGAFEDLNADDALWRARDGAEIARNAGFDAEARADVAAPTWQGIVDVADEIDAALIVIGSRGLSGLRERIEGSVSHDLAQHARRPILIVPPHRTPST